jgi:hypothetical protein
MAVSEMDIGIRLAYVRDTYTQESVRAGRNGRMNRNFMSFAAVLGLSALFAAPICPQEKAPAPANTLLQAALKKEKKPYKTVLVMFHATW